jgi:hypothetical protein
VKGRRKIGLNGLESVVWRPHQSACFFLDCSAHGLRGVGQDGNVRVCELVLDQCLATYLVGSELDNSWMRCSTANGLRTETSEDHENFVRHRKAHYDEYRRLKALRAQGRKVVEDTDEEEDSLTSKAPPMANGKGPHLPAPGP